MKDLRADWRKWTAGERSVFALFAIAMSGTVSVLLFLGLG
jgi:hypothetical protein